jgi:hypothetical protein
MAEQSWTIRLEFVLDEGEGEKRRTILETTGEHWNTKRAVNECIAIDMSSIMQMLLKSGNLILPTDLKSTVEAFGSEEF